MELNTETFSLDRKMFNNQITGVRVHVTELATDELGQTLVEYVLVMLLVALALIGALILLVPPLEALYRSVIGIF